MDRFIEYQCILTDPVNKDLKSNMDRFIEFAELVLLSEFII